METQTENKQEISKEMALAQFLEIDLEEAEKLIEDGNYIVYDDNEADLACAERIREDLWAFNYDFLCEYSSAIANIPKKSFRELQEKLCESFNDAILAMVGDRLADLIEDAIGLDGRGHFLSGYDEHEFELIGNYYAYRNN